MASVRAAKGRAAMTVLSLTWQAAASSLLSILSLAPCSSDCAGVYECMLHSAWQHLLLWQIVFSLNPPPVLFFWVSLKPECFCWFCLPYCSCLYNIIRHLLPTSTRLRLGGALQLTAILFILIEHAVFCIRHWLPSFISSPKDPRISAARPYSIVLLIWLQLASANENTLYWTSC